ncbi:MAG: HAD-IIIA family hydrolase [Eubacteriales bacterium]|nr:HAD-IIIA family hydrolase [Eubacteriales bacterium]
MKAVIMAGGQGSRLKSISGDLPKPMVPVNGKPILQYQIEHLKACGISDITLIIGHLGDAVKQYFGDGSAFGVRIGYFFEERPLGTAGALYYLKDELKEDFLLLMGDLMLDVDFCRFMDFHKACKGSATLFVHPNAHPYDSDIIVTDTAGRLSEFDEAHCGKHARIAASDEGEAYGALRRHARVTGVLGKKEERSACYHNQVNAGIYALSPEVPGMLLEPEEGKKLDLDRDVIRPLIAKQCVYAYRSTEYVKDMGTPDRYEAVAQDLKDGIVSSRNLKNKQKCIFLDRDGTINRLNGFIKHPDALVLMEGAAEAIKRINRSEYLCIVITNQPVIARGECSFEMLDEIHAKLETELGKAGAYIDGLYFCPHHRDRGFDGEVEALKFDCVCRKPGPGLLLLAAADYHIDLAKSWMIGDSPKDAACGKAAGTKTVLLSADAEASDPQADIICRDLSSAVDAVLA